MLLLGRKTAREKIASLLSIIARREAMLNMRAPSGRLIVDLPLTAIQGDLLSVAAWYDNEMGYSTRLAEMAAHIAA